MQKSKSLNQSGRFSLWSATGGKLLKIKALNSKHPCKRRAQNYNFTCGAQHGLISWCLRLLPSLVALNALDYYRYAISRIANSCCYGTGSAVTKAATELN
jgi:hypothetical protein